jgi:hypothetical protein
MDQSCPDGESQDEMSLFTSHGRREEVLIDYNHRSVGVTMMPL